MTWVEQHSGTSDPPVWEQVGNVRGPQGPAVELEVLPYTMVGILVARVGPVPFPISGGPFTIETVTARVGTVPIGSAAVFDVLVNGASIYADPASRPTIAAGQQLAVTGEHTTPAVAEGDYFTVEVVDTGLIPAADLAVVIRLRKSS